MTLFILAGILVTAGSLLYIFYPLLSSATLVLGWESSSPFKLLLDRKHTIFENIKDLDFEYKMGKLAEEDYQKLREEFSREAVEVLQQIDRLQPQPLDKPGEKRIVSVLKDKQQSSL